MSDFLTIEDVNGVLYSNQSFWWHTIYFDLLPNYDFTDLKYDFCRISRETSSGNYIFTIDVFNNNWTNGYDYDYNTGRVTGYSYDNGIKIGISTDTTEFVVSLYMGIEKVDNSPRLITYPIVDNATRYLTLKQIQENQSIVVRRAGSGTRETLSRKLEFGMNTINHTNPTALCGLLFVVCEKTDFIFNCIGSLTVGKINKVLLGTDSDYKPNGDYVGSYIPTITVEYKDTTIPVTWSETDNDYIFYLDLTDKTNAGKIRFKVNVDANETINTTVTDVVLQSNYATINSFNDFKTACGDNGTDIIRLGADLTATSDIPVTSSIKIIGDEHTINLDSHSFILNEDILFNAEQVTFDNGDTTIKQALNTKVELTSCTFTDCTSDDYNDIGSCIKCDVDIDSLDNQTDFTTILTDCLFVDNGNCILHGGELIVKDCKLHNTDITKINTNNVAFLYQTDGNASIRNCIFDIDYTSTTLCDNQQSIGYAQALLMIGETATINGTGYTELQQDNSLPFSDNPYNNQSHIFAKYYYNQISNCVFTSPTPFNENKASCHSVSGVDWIYKNNAQITRADSGNENTNRKIHWED